MNPRATAVTVFAALGWLSAAGPLRAGELTVDLGTSDKVTFVGALRRWDGDGRPSAPVDPKARIDRPAVAARARHLGGGRWAFRDLPPGRYDLVLLTAGRVRVEGFHYPPVLDLDLFLPPTAPAPDEETRLRIVGSIARSKHYENKVSPLFLAGDAKQVRVLVQLVRDLPTSYDAEYGAPVATVRHEVWQYTWRYGGWVKERDTRVLDRVLTARSELRKWTWVWEPRLGGIEVGPTPVRLRYEIPRRFDWKAARGWSAE